MMSTKVEIAIEKFKEGYNCAQSVVCTYAQDFHVKEEDAFRLSEGFGGGIPGVQTICGAASGMVMLAGLKNCPVMNTQEPTKIITYPCVKKMNDAFTEKMGALECRVLLQNKDNTIIDGKRAGCIACVRTACEMIEETLYEK